MALTVLTVSAQSNSPTTEVSIKGKTFEKGNGFIYNKNTQPSKDSGIATRNGTPQTREYINQRLFQRHSYIISLVMILLTTHAPVFGQSDARVRYPDIDLYYRWQEAEARDSVYLKAYRRYLAETEGGDREALHNPAGRSLKPKH